MSPEVSARLPRMQLAALPWRRLEAQFEVLMITSRLSRHWLIPKGWPMKGRNDAEAAAREAYEEAGVKGAISRAALGSYQYSKQLSDGTGILCRVEVYPLQVERELSKWPEAGGRKRRWMTLAEAAAVAFEPGLANFLFGLDDEAILSTLNPPRQPEPLFMR
ncbi:MAG TPA: NUDIX hydrolase [Devosiaceae bacterium]|nr:NUDIX hydrolase [Devosiaceae bacterium]